MKKIIACLLLTVSMLMLFNSCNHSEQTETSDIGSGQTTYYATLSCPDDPSVDGTVVEVFWKKGYYFPTPKKSFYSFDGWLLDDNNLQSVGIWPYARSAELVAQWKPVTYTISYIMSPVLNDAYTTYDIEDDDFVLPNPRFVAGKLFLGWTGENIDTPTKVISISKGSYGNREYIANWLDEDEIQYRLDGFAFEIVEDYAVVVGYFGEPQEKLYIPSEYNGFPVKTIGEGALYGLGGVITEWLHIPYSVTTIEDNALGSWSGQPMSIVGGDFEDWKANLTVGEGNGKLSEMVN